jgi:hypothetical protein
MAMIRVRSASVYINGKKGGTFEKNDYEFNSGDEPQFGDPGLVGFSDGATTTKLTLDGLNPLLGGDSLALYNAMINKSDVTVSLFPVDGQTHTITMRVISGGATSDHKSGAQNSKWTLSGGAPKIS